MDNSGACGLVGRIPVWIYTYYYMSILTNDILTTALMSLLWLFCFQIAVLQRDIYQEKSGNAFGQKS